MKLRPDEITSILKQRIEEYSVETDLAEVGTLHGETHGSPMSPLLHSSSAPTLDGLRSGKARLRLPTALFEQPIRQGAR